MANRVIIRTEFGVRITTLDAKTKEEITVTSPMTDPDQLLTKWVNENDLTILGMSLSPPKIKDISLRSDYEQGRQVLRTEYSMTIWVSGAEVSPSQTPRPPVFGQGKPEAPQPPAPGVPGTLHTDLQANAIINDAQVRAEQMIAQAQSQAQALVEQARAGASNVAARFQHNQPPTQ